MGNTIQMMIPARPEAPAMARSAVEGLIGEMGPGRVDDLRLLISELVTNAVLHAGLDRDDLIEIRVETDGNSFARVQVTDSGYSFSPSSVLDPAALHPSSHWGLYIVDRIADRWGVDPGSGKTVWFELFP